ncbi:hypothetical protein PAXRUDRAFT_140006 [Paxillus rubicundulus Ve08.2h10]|uniref:Uncharacterized protein n=1 Tax=Paxillus rubicundulus Ve08.2h10 TaxID=930991 RepID=A0A0D0DRL2_9AGAM|nr:hypothetical protein PAXRUDRAFT_140006 [Paxillus rubicundulus Ve08.2h10]
MSGNTILLNIEGIVPVWDMYMLSLDIKYPGEKVSHCTSLQQTQSEDCTETSSMIEQEQDKPNISIKDEEEAVTSQELKEMHGSYVR